MRERERERMCVCMEHNCLQSAVVNKRSANTNLNDDFAKQTNTFS